MKSLYREYFQKSKVFLYPLLSIQRGISTIPKETYVAWEDRIHPAEEKLICSYDCIDHADYKSFRNNVLLKHNLIYDFETAPDGLEIFIFDLTGMGSDYTHFLHGRYSQFSEYHKNVVLDFFVESDRTGELIMSYLNPSQHYDDYARLLDVDRKVLEEVGELCTKPDLKLETLILNL